MEQRQEQPQQLQGQGQELETFSSLDEPCLQAEVQPQQNLGSNIEEIEPMSVDQCDEVRGVEVPQLVRAPEGAVALDAGQEVKGDGGMVDVEVKFVEMGKRKRGRPPRAGPVKPTRPAPPSQRKKRDEEDVCFICFDGGSLVLCDRKGCPKAYHPSCIKRDESFFRSRAKWNCGWHICSSCRKASYYMCYTCTYSLCKGCTKDADYFNVRGNKGFCGTCMRTIMLIENSAVGSQETVQVQVDFDDKSSWEYLFKVYWVYLKGKLHLTLDELTQAKNPWNGLAITAPMGESSSEVHDGNFDKGPNSENFSGNVEANHAKRRKTKKQPQFLNNLNSLNTERSGGDEGTSLPSSTKWATDDLLEFVAHMKNGDTSMLSPFDVQALVLEYIKKNNLRDRYRQCQILCDERLYNLFERERVGHFEMLSLLETHFLNRANSSARNITAGVIDAVANQVVANATNDNQLMMENDRRRKTRKKADKRGAQVKLDEYAAIDVHNINLIYLKRSFAENLIGESDQFQNKVVGSIVRIKISGTDPKQDMYRLVRITGTTKAAEPYKIGERKTDVMLEILNLHKKEVLPIDAISNQEFSEDECRRLRQSIKCGLMKYLTVGEIQEKAVTLNSQRVDDSLEAEILRLGHLRDRASEKGHRKELRECIEKLQLLSSPEERKRRLVEIPEVHTDPKMDPSYESEEDAGEFDGKKPGNCMRPINPSFGGKEGEPLSPQKIGDALNDLGSRAEKRSATTLERNTNISTTFYVDRDGTTRVNQRANVSTNDQDSSTSSVSGGWNNNAVRSTESFSGVASGEFLPPNSLGIVQPAVSVEIEKTWHYQDPTGKIQGPFSMVQLRKWSQSGHFPLDLRVWSANQKQDDSILLTDALNGQEHKESLLLHNNYLLSQEVRATSVVGGKTRDCEWSGSLHTMDKDIKRVEGSLNPMQNNGIIHSKINDEVVMSSEWGSQSSSSWPDQPSVSDSLPSPTPSERPCETLSLQVKKNQGGEMRKSDHNSLNGHLHKTMGGQTNIELGSDRQVDSEGNSGQSSGQKCRSPPIDSCSNAWDSNSAFVALLKSLDMVDQNQEIHFSDLPSPTPKPSHFDFQGRAPEMKESVSSNVPVQDSSNQEIDFSDLPSPTPKASHCDIQGQAPEIKESVSSNVPVQDSSTSWPDQPSVCNSLPSPTPSGKLCETSHQVKESQGGETWKYKQSSVDGGLPRNTIDQINIGRNNDKQVDSEGKSGLSSGQNSRPPPIDNSTNGWNSNSGFVSLANSLEITDQNQEIDFSDLPGPTPKPSHFELQVQAPEINKSVSPDAPHQDSGPSWSTASSPVAGGPQLPDVAGDWGGYSPTPAKPSLEKWESDLMPASALKPTEVPSDHAATPTSGSCQFTHSSPSHPTSNAASWQAIVVTEPDEFTTLSEESVSDLLAEVEAMESLNGLASPTSTLRCGIELTQGSDNDCFSPLEGLSPTLETGRSASLSSSSDLQIHSQSTVTDEPLGVSQADVLDPPKSSGGRSSTSNELEEDTKPSDDSVNQCEAASDISPPLPPVTGWDLPAMDGTWRSGSETTNISTQGVVQGNANLGLGGLAQGITNMDWENGQWAAQDHVSMTLGVSSVGNLGIWGGQPRYSGDRLSSPRDRDFHGRDSNFGRGRPMWNRQAVYDANGGGSFRPPNRGQRVCKFYESGYCKKGASCSYLHP